MWLIKKYQMLIKPPESQSISIKSSPKNSKCMCLVFIAPLTRRLHRQLLSLIYSISSFSLSLPPVNCESLALSVLCYNRCLTVAVCPSTSQYNSRFPVFRRCSCAQEWSSHFQNNGRNYLSL